MANTEALVQVLQEIIAPLIEADGGELYLVNHSPDEVKLHLAGTCSGCPGAALTNRGVITPALRTTNPQLRVVVTTGYLIPQGSTRVQAAQRTALRAGRRPDAARRAPPALFTRPSTGSSARPSSNQNNRAGAT